MNQFILFSPAKEEFNFKGVSLGMGTDRAIYYLKSIGKKRLYRSSYPKSETDPTSKHLTLLTFENKDKAEKELTNTNDLFNDDFQVKEI